ncbi:MAG: hypothetical protein ABI209_02530 [Edaphobacter sp.]
MKSKGTKKSVQSPREVDLVVGEKIDVSFERKRDYPGVVMQQGRVPLDPDSNEQGAIDGRPQRFKKKLNKP